MQLAEPWIERPALSKPKTIEALGIFILSGDRIR
jgi:hypothetical protein